MNTYSFSYINQFGNGEVVEVKDLTSDQEAMLHGRELLELYVRDISDRELRRQDWQDPCIGIDKWADGYPAADTFGTEDTVEPMDTAYVVYKRDNGTYNDDCTEFNYHCEIKEQGFKA